MSETFWIVLIIAVVFLTLALVATLKYDSVSNTIKFRDFSIGIKGENKSKEREISAPQIKKPTRKKFSPKKTGSARVFIGGSVDNSSITAEGETEGTVKVKKEVHNSTIRASGINNAEAAVEGKVKNSDINSSNNRL